MVAEDVKKSFGAEPDYNGLLRDGAIHFIQIMLTDDADTLVENARNYITFNVAGNTELLGMDNCDSTDYDEYVSATGRSHTRKFFTNRLIAIVRTKSVGASFVITAASTCLQNVSMKYNGTKNKWSEVAPYMAIRPEMTFVQSRKIELLADGSTKLDAGHREVRVTAKVLPENATIKEINWNPVLKECIASDNITVNQVVKCPTGRIETTAIIRATGDGDCILRCTAQNGTRYDEVISDLPFSVSGIGSNVNLDFANMDFETTAL